MLDCASGFLEHDVAEAGIVGAGGTVGYGEVHSRLVAVQENGDVVYLARAVRRELVRKRQLAVRGDIESDLEELWMDRQYETLWRLATRYSVTGKGTGQTSA